MTNIWKNQLSTFISHNKNYEIIHELSNARTFLCSLNYSSEMKYLDKWLQILPSKWMYSFLEYSKSDNPNELDIFLQKDFMDKLLETISHLKTAWIFLDFILPKNHLSFIYDALQLPSVQNYISYIKLRFMNLSSALEVLDLLYNCVNIEFIDLYYTSWSSISNPDETIDQAKKSFINKRGVISKLIISQDTNKD